MLTCLPECPCRPLCTLQILTCACRHLDLPDFEGEARGGALDGGVVAAARGEQGGSRVGWSGVRVVVGAPPAQGFAPLLSLRCCALRFSRSCRARQFPLPSLQHTDVHADPSPPHPPHPPPTHTAPEAVLRFRHADGQPAKALACVGRKRRLRLSTELNRSGAVYVAGDGLDLVLPAAKMTRENGKGGGVGECWGKGCAATQDQRSGGGGGGGLPSLSSPYHPSSSRAACAQLLHPQPPIHSP